VKRSLLLLLACLAVAFAGVAVTGCGGDEPGDGGGATSTSATAPGPATNPTPRPESGDVLVAALGDSITAGSPLWDPDPAVRDRIGDELDPRSRYEYWYQRTHPRYRFRNCGVFGQRTDEIAQRLATCAAGAKVLVLQGGINDIAQGRPVTDAADDLAAMMREGKRLGLRVVAVEVLPWNNGYPKAAPLIAQLNGYIHEAAEAQDIAVAPWFSVLEDPARPGRMRKALTIDGDHPSVEGYRRLAEALPLP
jgi:lysophospholipase L1-like esterase